MAVQLLPLRNLLEFCSWRITDQLIWNDADAIILQAEFMMQLNLNALP